MTLEEAMLWSRTRLRGYVINSIGARKRDEDYIDDICSQALISYWTALRDGKEIQNAEAYMIACAKRDLIDDYRKQSFRATITMSQSRSMVMTAMDSHSTLNEGPAAFVDEEANPEHVIIKDVERKQRIERTRQALAQLRPQDADILVEAYGWSSTRFNFYPTLPTWSQRADARGLKRKTYDARVFEAAKKFRTVWKEG